MIRTLLVTTALTALTSGAAIAQSNMSSDETKPMNNTGMQSEATMSGAASSELFISASADDMLASSLIGSQIFSSTADDAEVVGDVNDVLMTPEGETEAVIVGVGGFLGISEKEVAIAFDQLEQQAGPDGEERLVLTASRTDLESAPTFDRSVLEDGEMRDETAALENRAQSDNPAMTPRDGTMQPQSTGAETDAMTTASTDETGTMDTSEPLRTTSGEEVSAEELIGTAVMGSEGEEIGEIGDVLLTAEGEVEAFIIDVGGFLGIGEKPVALGAQNVEISTNGSEELEVHAQFAQADLENAPAYSDNAYKTNPDDVVLR